MSEREIGEDPASCESRHDAPSSEEERDPREHEEDDEEHLGHADGARSDAREGEYRRDERDDEEDGRPVEHETLPFLP